MRKRIFSLIIFSQLFLLGILAQKNIIDEVIWIVGDDAIFRSDVEQQRLFMQNRNIPMEGDPYCIIPEEIAIQKLFLHQASLDSVEVSESQVMSNVEMQLNYNIAMIGSREKLEEYFGQSISQIREDLRDNIRNQMIFQQMRQKLVGDINATPADVRRFYNNLPQDSIPTVPTQVELQIVSFEPPVPIEETNRVKDRLREFADRINNGEADFSVLARLYSEDIESAKRGGELDFMGRGQLVSEYAAVAFNLTDPTKVSRVVETEFGFHIIQLMERRGDRIKTRHILLRPRISYEDKNKAFNTLDSIANLIRANKMTFEQGVMQFSEDKSTAFNAGLMYNEKTNSSKFEYQDLPAEVAKAVYNMNVGEISKPFSMMNSNNKEVVAIVKLKSKVDTHKANLTDDYQLLKSYYETRKGDEFLEEWIKKKQKETYISIDPAWRNCEFKYPGWIK